MLKRIYIVWQFNIIWQTIPNKTKALNLTNFFELKL